MLQTKTNWNQLKFDAKIKNVDVLEQVSVIILIFCMNNFSLVVIIAYCLPLADWLIEFLRPSPHIIGHFGDVSL